ncbi:hypothetical protein TNCT_245871 [Trichonephila clavata]|uniref:Uncharacterized protein n=1 Tax=Trichonephila clavata TaxID=2740835 RepID=A0A8X6FZE4_TRICU|nr:hypothetical protein TNCT_245871 [Trichonephila clavata]
MHLFTLKVTFVGHNETIFEIGRITDVICHRMFSKSAKCMPNSVPLKQGNKRNAQEPDKLCTVNVQQELHGIEPSYAYGEQYVNWQQSYNRHYSFSGTCISKCVGYLRKVL